MNFLPNVSTSANHVMGIGLSMKLISSLAGKSISDVLNMSVEAACAFLLIIEKLVKDYN